jgi:hypothetical protein
MVLMGLGCRALDRNSHSSTHTYVYERRLVWWSARVFLRGVPRVSLGVLRHLWMLLHMEDDM